MLFSLLFDGIGFVSARGVKCKVRLSCSFPLLGVYLMRVELEVCGSLCLRGNAADEIVCSLEKHK